MVNRVEVDNKLDEMGDENRESGSSQGAPSGDAVPGMGCSDQVGIRNTNILQVNFIYKFPGCQVGWLAGWELIQIPTTAPKISQV